VRTRIVLADDHPIVREGLRYIIDRNKGLEIVHEAVNGRETIRFAERKSADVYVLDIAMPELNGIEATRRLVKMNPQNKVIILSFKDDRRSVEQAFAAGAKGYVLKESGTQEVVNAIREVDQGRFYLSPAISNYIVDGFLEKASTSAAADRASLTSREKEVLQLIGEGHSDKQISLRLNLSPSTVHVHRKNIRCKLDMHKQADLIRYAIKEGFSPL